MTNCGMEMCPHWTGDGRVCMCVELGINPSPDFSSDTLTDLLTAQRERDEAVALLERISELPCAPVGRDNCPACMARAALDSIAAAAPVDGAE